MKLLCHDIVRGRQDCHSYCVQPFDSFQNNIEDVTYVDMELSMVKTNFSMCYFRNGFPSKESGWDATLSKSLT
jgi:hypothetical protein